MDKLISVLSRWGTAELIELIGSETVEILDALDAKNIAAHRLARLAVELNGAESFVTHKTLRDRLLQGLSRDDAKHLLRWLGKSANDEDVWTSLLRLRYTPTSESGQVLRKFLQIPENVDETKRVPAPDSQLIAPAYGLFAHQAAAARKVLSFLVSRTPRAILHMPTGSGKTRTAMNVISELFRLKLSRDSVVLWLAHSEELCEQASEEFSKAWSAIGDHELKVHRRYGPHRVDYDDADHGFFVGSLRLLYMDSSRHQSDFLRFARRVGCVVMDEAHQAVAPTYEHLLNIIAPHQSTSVLGLTATPGRSWMDAGEDLELAKFFRAQKVGLEIDGYKDPVAYLQDEGYLSETHYESVPFRPGADFTLTSAEQQRLAETMDLPSSVIDRLAMDQRRNLLILERIMIEADRKKKIIVFACSVEHARLLANLLSIKGYTAAAIAGDTPEHERRRAIREFRNPNGVQILTNYGVLTTGFDAPKAEVAVITRPTQSVVLYTQMVGRVARGPRQGGTESCRVITVVDDLPGFRSLAEGFTHWEDIWSEEVAQELGLRS